MIPLLTTHISQRGVNSSRVQMLDGFLDTIKVPFLPSNSGVDVSSLSYLQTGRIYSSVDEPSLGIGICVIILHYERQVALVKIQIV